MTKLINPWLYPSAGGRRAPSGGFMWDDFDDFGGFPSATGVRAVAGSGGGTGTGGGYGAGFDPYGAALPDAEDAWAPAQAQLNWLTELRQQEAAQSAQEKQDVRDRLERMTGQWNISDLELNQDLAGRKYGFETETLQERRAREAARDAEERALEDSLDTERWAAEADPHWRGRSNNGMGPAERARKFAEDQALRVRNTRRTMSDAWRQWATGLEDRTRSFGRDLEQEAANRRLERERQKQAEMDRARQDLRDLVLGMNRTNAPAAAASSAPAAQAAAAAAQAAAAPNYGSGAAYRSQTNADIAAHGGTLSTVPVAVDYDFLRNGPAAPAAFVPVPAEQVIQYARRGLSWE